MPTNDPLPPATSRCQQPRPYTFVAQAGVKYAYCRCGDSRSYPLCDGSHRDRTDGVTPIKVIPAETTTFTWCRCGRSEAVPDCDGSQGEGAGDSESRGDPPDESGT